MKPLEYGQFRVVNTKKAKQDTNKEEDEDELEAEYPDLKVFADCARLSDQPEILLLRP